MTVIRVAVLGSWQSLCFRLPLDAVAAEREEIWKRHGTEFVTRDW
jgi:hypothetical protein